MSGSVTGEFVEANGCQCTSAFDILVERRGDRTLGPSLRFLIRVAHACMGARSPRLAVFVPFVVRGVKLNELNGDKASPLTALVLFQRL
jgi:hypothetical protein